VLVGPIKQDLPFTVYYSVQTLNSLIGIIMVYSCTAPPAESSDTVTYSVQLDKDHQQLGIVLGTLSLYCYFVM